VDQFKVLFLFGFQFGDETRETRNGAGWGAARSVFPGCPAALPEGWLVGHDVQERQDVKNFMSGVGPHRRGGC